MTGAANINACFSALFGVEVGQIDSGLIGNIDPTRLGMPVEEHLHLVHHHLMPRMPKIWDIG